MARIPDNTAQKDQITAGLNDTAEILWNYFHSLVRKGFSEDQAMTFVADYHNLVMTSQFFGAQNTDDEEYTDG